jgi:hypothetical protein
MNFSTAILQVQDVYTADTAASSAPTDCSSMIPGLFLLYERINVHAETD